MYYMMANLAANSPMNQEALQIILSLSVHVIEIFALIFLFYTNSFLIKRRKREIGVYHILGMGKPQLAKMLVIETVVTGAVSILGGIFFGTALAKLMYALLKRMIHYDDKLAFRMSWEIAGNTVLFFTLIFALTLIYNLLQIRLANPIELLHAGSQGEREPKTKWLLTVAGIIFLGIGYYIAITTKEPLKALQLFFVAVICVIIGTYALFTAGSIAFLKLLRKNKNFYYKNKAFYIRIRHALPDEAECSRAVKYLCAQYYGSGDHFVYRIFVHRKGGCLKNKVSTGSVYYKFSI